MSIQPVSNLEHKGIGHLKWSLKNSEKFSVQAMVWVINDGENFSTPVLPASSETASLPLKKKSSMKITLIFTVLAVAFGTNFGIYSTSVVNNLKPPIVEYMNETKPMKWLAGNGTSLNPHKLWSIVVSSFTAGQLNALLQTAFGLGDLSGMIISIPELLGTLTLSPYALSLTMIFSIVQFSVMCFAYESPRFLILKRNRLDDGIKAVKYYQEIQAENKVHAENGLVNTDGLEQPQALRGHLFQYLSKKPLRLACLLLAVNGLTGISPVMTYSTDAYLDNRLPRYAQWCTVALGLSNFVGSFAAVGLMESWGRKPLMITGIIGCFVSITSFTVVSLVLSHDPSSDPYWAYILVLCLVSFLLFYSLCGAANNTLAAEICPQTYRSTAVSLAIFSLMTVSTVLLLTYEFLKESFGHQWVFFPSSALSMLLGMYLASVVPETKDRTLTELKEYFER
uniref:Major facilitator superfamily (MFS) profile domain-containing protein n=1 Tax=Romanomermis culicivorax TaxID=13658 RepID=A0A915JZ29_ROMCU